MNTNNQDLKSILNVLRKALKAQGLIYADVAIHLDVSEITIKRLFAGASVSMNHLLAVCDLLHIPFLEVANLAREMQHPEYVLNKVQDRFFANHPRMYALFIDLYRRKPSREVKKKWNLNEQVFFKYLREFEKLGLLEVLPGNAYRFLVSGPIRVPARGNLRQVFLQQNVRFLDFVQSEADNPKHLLQTSEVLMAEHHIEEFLQEIKGVFKRFRSQAFADETILAANQKTSIRWLFAFAPFETDWQRDIK